MASFIVLWIGCYWRHLYIYICMYIVLKYKTCDYRPQKMSSGPINFKQCPRNNNLLLKLLIIKCNNRKKYHILIMMIIIAIIYKAKCLIVNVWLFGTEKKLVFTKYYDLVNGNINLLTTINSVKSFFIGTILVYRNGF